MNNLYVEDISNGELASSKYDIVFFSSGYEERCLEVPSIIHNQQARHVVILEYNEHKNDDTRKDVDLFYQTYWKEAHRVEKSHSDASEIYQEILHAIENKAKGEVLRVLVDYTSMSRVWYSSIINILLHHIEQPVCIDFTYTNGYYQDVNLNVELGSLKVIPGCEGSALTKKNTAAIFMLGFDRNGPHRLYNIINPSKSYGILASPAASHEYVGKCIDENRLFIEHQLGGEKNILNLPINSLSICYEQLLQVINPLLSDYNVTIVPFGPKPHILASVLCGMTNKSVTCMYSEYIRNSTSRVESRGEVTISRVHKLA
ncbi:hypothetical protein BCT30_05505 [Enterovibrio norvegicus]|uniref:hypothetical protein n=1 Tax=Enterovibrio norvegicus TaxID=188144 RepID=UPI000C849286|nr:hypothetical protein [Enterovibrio norvegicus]MCC4797592.1 hypothetical protein [Enterovibrio norvegicus]PMI35161.1 hypothetical protein BCU46_19320 [Enterovibrio norvegicus]PMN43781.1 hypothetical protein BCT30_05505 [Enterovibrio norvegicus]